MDIINWRTTWQSFSTLYPHWMIHALMLSLQNNATHCKWKHTAVSFKVQFRYPPPVSDRNASLVQLSYTLNRAAKLIYNESETTVSDALTTCLFPKPACSASGTFITIQDEISCIISLNFSTSFVLNDTLMWILDEIVDQNAIASNASNSSDCDTL